MSSIPEKTLDDLSWQRICQEVARRCPGSLSTRLEQLPLADSEEGAKLALSESKEAFAALRDAEPLPLSGIRDLGDGLSRVSRQGALDAPTLRDLRLTLGAGRVLRKFLGMRKSAYPGLYAACGFDPSLDSLEDELSHAIDSDGTLSDNASRELRRLRTETANLRGRLVRRLESIIHAKSSILSDAFHTIREGRYVIPLRTDAHEKIPGIVHGTSASGATVFVEPRALVEQGNRLKIAQAELEREEARILAELSLLVFEQLASVRAAFDSLDHACLRHASAVLAKDIAGVFLPLSGAIDLKAFRHPLLQLDEDNVVPNDMQLSPGQALIVSGPNAGGKTVALKAIGLFSLMVRAGLPVPAEEGSTFAFFDSVLSDVGDGQSITSNLSTFSAHMKNVSQILGLAGPRSLVLLDELASGTDPHEGAALACAIVDALCRRGATTAVTTHYEALKAMAAKDDRLRNSAVGFDIESLMPTFALQHGVPGASAALSVAARYGIPQDVVDLATQVIPEQSRTFDELVRELEAQRAALLIERDAVRQELAAAKAARSDAELRLADLRKQDKKKISKESQALREHIRKANDDLRAARQKMRKRADADSVRQARQALEDAAKIAAKHKVEEAPSEEAVSREAASNLSVGTRVWVTELRKEVEIIEAPARGKVRVVAGPLKLWVDVAGVRAAGDVVAKKPRANQTVKEAPKKEAPRNGDNTLDLRGLRSDEAVAMTEAFLDRLYGDSQNTAYIVHGSGTGALRLAIRELLERSNHYVTGFRSGHSTEGGEGLTVVRIK